MKSFGSAWNILALDKYWFHLSLSFWPWVPFLTWFWDACVDQPEQVPDTTAERGHQKHSGSFQRNSVPLLYKHCHTKCGTRALESGRLGLTCGEVVKTGSSLSFQTLKYLYCEASEGGWLILSWPISKISKDRFWRQDKTRQVFRVKNLGVLEPVSALFPWCLGCHCRSSPPPHPHPHPPTPPPAPADSGFTVAPREDPPSSVQVPTQLCFSLNSSNIWLIWRAQKLCKVRISQHFVIFARLP